MREAGGSDASKSLVEATFEEMQTLTPPARDGAARAQRRLRMTRAMRQQMERPHAEWPRFQMRRVLRFGALAVAATVAIVVLVVVGDRAPNPPTVADVDSTLKMNMAIGVLEGTLTVSHAGTRRWLQVGEHTPVSVQDALETTAGEDAQVRLSDVGRVTLAPRTRIVGVDVASGIGNAGGVDRLTLLTGRAHLSISKLGAGRSFRVITAHAAVHVHGTEFDVEVGAETTPGTCVRVQEGLVEVVAGSQRTFLGPGRTWGCEAKALSTDSQPAAATSRVGAAAGLAAGDLHIQNALFERALRAERAGRHTLAVETYRRLLERYPQGPLAAQAKNNLTALSRPER